MISADVDDRRRMLTDRALSFRPFAILKTRCDSESVLQQIVALMQQNPALKLRVEGHTDNVGAAAANQALSE